MRAESCILVRPRDAFDVFISVTNQDAGTFAQRWMELLSDGLFSDANRALVEAIDKGDAIAKIEAQISELGSETIPSSEDIVKVFSFLAR